MGLSSASIGRGAASGDDIVRRRSETDRIIALAGNPNVGKSTLFNALTGMNQHTGNWPGKTVASARGSMHFADREYILVDLPGTYSLLAHSAEEEIARDFICFADADAAVIVCDASMLERNLNLVLQVLEITGRALICLNLADEAARRGIHIDREALEARLSCPVVTTSARDKKGLDTLTCRLDALCDSEGSAPRRIHYGSETEELLAILEAKLDGKCAVPPRAAAVMLLTDERGVDALSPHFRGSESELAEIGAILASFADKMDAVADDIARSVSREAASICRGIVRREKSSVTALDRRIDAILTGKITGFPIMLLLLALVFWITIKGANYPSELLRGFFTAAEGWLDTGLVSVGCPDFLRELTVYGAFRVLGWVVAVMLPPMAIFFPLFTLLEDLGYLPRVAFNLDRCFKGCHACGKQALTMCMGFGCNAAGVVGCRIIDSPRERMIAILTNNFVPCNGRLPILVSIIALFIAGSGIASALTLTFFIILGIVFTLIASRLLSATLLRGMPSSFTLELPPIRRPKVWDTIVRSVFDRTLSVLGRAVTAAVPAGCILWLASNLQIGGASLIAHIAAALDPIGRFMGMDGVILTAFLFGLPANEIVIPVMLMIYSSGRQLVDIAMTESVFELLAANGWSTLTAVCVLLFTLMHWPCATTVMTIKKESGSLLWTAAAVLLPTLMGMLCCALTAAAARMLGIGV